MVMISDLGYPAKRRCSRHPELVFVASNNQGAVDFLRNHILKPVKNEDYGNHGNWWKKTSPLHTSTCRTCCHNFLHLCEKTHPNQTLWGVRWVGRWHPSGQRDVAYAAPQADSAMALGLTSKIIKILIVVCRCPSRNTTDIRWYHYSVSAVCFDPYVKIEEKLQLGIFGICLLACPFLP